MAEQKGLIVFFSAQFFQLTKIEVKNLFGPFSIFWLTKFAAEKLSAKKRLVIAVVARAVAMLAKLHLERVHCPVQREGDGSPSSPPHPNLAPSLCAAHRLKNAKAQRPKLCKK